MKKINQNTLPFIAIILFLSGIAGCKSSEKTSNVSTIQSNRIAFYNVENLFDIYDDPKTKDDEFTPNGKKKWTAKRYDKKLRQISTVVQDMEFPDIVGFCEVENKKVLQDLTNTELLNPYQYEVVHFDSPDFRGIDNGLIFKADQFELLHSDYFRINFPPKIVQDYTTRDILYARGIYRRTDTLHIFINHWPSRRGGVKESEPKRVFVAKELKKQIDLLQSKNPNAKILVMGDLNDETDNASVNDVICGKTKSPATQMINLTAPIDQAGKGTYRYRNNWNMLDQIIISSSLRSGNFVMGDAKIFQPDYLTYQDKKFGPRPNKTYGGPNYYGGYSDHYPVFVTVKVK